MPGIPVVRGMLPMVLREPWASVPAQLYKQLVRSQPTNSAGNLEVQCIRAHRFPSDE